MESVLVLIVLAVILVPFGVGVYIAWEERQLPKEQRSQSHRARRRAERPRYIDPFDPVEMHDDLMTYLHESMRMTTDSETSPARTWNDNEKPSEAIDPQPLTTPDYWRQIVALEPTAATESLIGSVEAIVIPPVLVPLPGWVAVTDHAVYVASQDFGDVEGPISNSLRMPIEAIWPVNHPHPIGGSPDAVAIRLFHVDPAKKRLVQTYISAGTAPYEAVGAHCNAGLSITVEIQADDMEELMRLVRTGATLHNDGRY